MGDAGIVPVLKETSRVGYRKALQHKLGMNEKTLSAIWKGTLVNYYHKYDDLALNKPTGKMLLYKENIRDICVSPSISPNGEFLTFFSEKDIYTFDLYLANVATGTIIRKLLSAVKFNDIDDFNFIESSGTWSPDNKYFAVTVSSNGRNELAIVDIHNGHIISKYPIPGIPSFNNPAWSPDGENIILSGMVEGQTSLFIFNLRSRQATRLTDDSYSYIQPAWSGDSKYVVFSTDKPFNDSDTVPKRGMNIGLIDVSTRQVNLIRVFNGAKNLNPCFSADNKSIYFLSDRDGFRNLYLYSLSQQKTYQLTQLLTGISGITEYSPAISISRGKEILTYSYYNNAGYSLYSANKGEFKLIEVPADSTNYDAATFPPLDIGIPFVKSKNPDHVFNRKTEISDSFKIKPYHPKFQLDYISNLNAGLSVGQFGTGPAGSIFALFSDITGQNQIYSGISVNGDIYDFSGIVSYMNLKHPLAWGVSLSHTPNLYGYQGYIQDTIISGNNKIQVNNYPVYIERVFEDKLSLFAFKAFSKTRRLEAGISSSWNYFRLEVYNNYYNENGNFAESNMTLGTVPSAYILHSLEMAYVTDNSYFGMTGPVNGHRSRFEIDTHFGGIFYNSFLIDLRKYFYIKPFTIAMRGLISGRSGSGANDYRLPGLYIGYPWYIHGYDINTFKNISSADTGKLSVNNLSGTNLAVSNVEIRFPFTGPGRVTLIKSRFLLSDLSLFFDAGIAWQNGSDVSLKWKPETPLERTPLYSTGGSVRINLFGFMVIEPYIAFPLQVGGLNNPVYGINFIPGW